MAIRQLAAHFPGTCQICRGTFRKGERIYWNSSTKQSFHYGCFTGHTPESDPSELEVESKAVAVDYTFGIEYGELKTRALQQIAGDFSFLKVESNRKLAASHQSRWGTSFFGFKLEEFKTWLTQGFKTETLQNLTPESPPIRKKRKVIYSDEGELQVELALSGFDYPFLDWTKRESVPGLAVNVEMSFQAGVSAKVIQEYEAWLAKTLYSLETEGIDLEVSVFFNSRGIFANKRERKAQTRIRVKREQEATDFASWSVIFSPAGFRGMVFLAVILTADSKGEECSSGLGNGIGQRDWAVSFDSEARSLDIRCPYTPRDFPAEVMTEKLRAVVRQFH